MLSFARLLCACLDILLALTVPAKNERGPQYMDQAFAAIHQGDPHRLPLMLAVARVGKEVTLCCRCPEGLRPLVEGQLYAHYPDARITALLDEALDPPAGTVTWRAPLRLAPDLFPIRRYGQFEDALNRQSADPLSAILTTLAANRKQFLEGRIELTIRPARSRVIARARRCLHRLNTDFFRRHHALARLYLRAALSHRAVLRLAGWLLGRFARAGDAHPPASLSTSGSRLHEREEDLQAAADKLGRLLFEARVRLSVSGPPDQAEAAEAKLREMAAAFGQFSSPRMASFRAGRIHRPANPPWRFRSVGFLLSTEELATIFHPPTFSVRAPALAAVTSRQFEPPVALPTPATHSRLTILGMTNFRAQRTRFGILPDDRRRHLILQGKTGMGKSTLLLHLLTSDVAAGGAGALIDPHGDLIESVLPLIPPSRSNDVILFDAGDAAYPLSFNVLACRSASERPLVASGVLTAFKKLYGDFFGPRMEHIFRNALLALLELPGTSLVSLLRLLSDRAYREAVTSRLSDPMVRAFWQQEFAGMPPKLQAEAVAPVQNKVGAFISSPLLRHLVGQSRSSLDLRDVMDGGKILLVNLSKGRIGEDASTLLGSLLITAVQIAAMSRADQPEEQRRDFGLFVDEFTQFATDSFSSILSEARKYRLSLTLSGQFLSQMDEATAAAVFGNIGSMVCFQVGAQDAEVLAGQLGGGLTSADLQQLPRYQAYVRLLIDGMPSRPFTMSTLPPPARCADPRRAAAIRNYCRQRYARPVAQVEREIAAAFA